MDFQYFSKFFDLGNFKRLRSLSVGHHSDKRNELRWFCVLHLQIVDILTRRVYTNSKSINAWTLLCTVLLLLPLLYDTVLITAICTKWLNSESIITLIRTLIKKPVFLSCVTYNFYKSVIREIYTSPRRRNIVFAAIILFLETSANNNSLSRWRKWHRSKTSECPELYGDPFISSLFSV